MNIMEETTGTYRVRIEGITIRQIKDIFEDKWGALMWANGGAYPAEDVRLQFIKEPRIEADEALMRTGLQSLEDSIDIVRHEYLTDWRHGIPTRKAQLAGIKEIFDRHEAAITALRKRLESSNAS